MSTYSSCEPTNDINIDEILKGKFDVLPNEKPAEIRILISSTTFEDYEVERNYLFENVYLDLRNYCLKQYLKDLIVIDRKWGITPECENNELTANICREESSIGSYFVALLSHRYGYTTLKSCIDENEFNLIKSELSIDLDALNLLEMFYALDENSLQNREYKLKSSLEIMDTKKIDKSAFNSQYEQLKDKIFKAVENCFNKNQLTIVQKHCYFNSTSAIEIENGIINSNEVDLRSLVFFREIENVPPDASTSFIEHDDDKIKLLNSLKKNVENKLPTANKYYYKIDWTKTNNFEEEGDCSEHSEHIKTYLKQFSENFKISLNVLLAENLKKESKQCDAEVLRHARHCLKLNKNYIRRPYLKVLIKQYLDKSDNINPYVISGPMGAGKSCLMAYLAKYIKEKHPQTIVITRFIGLSRESSTMSRVIQSILKQLSPNEEIDNDLNTTELRDKLIQKLKTLSVDNKILILLDSIDQLSTRDHGLNWMFYELPKNVKIIYSVLSSCKTISMSLKKRNPKNYLEIEKLKFYEAHRILSALLANSNRMLNEKQWSVLDNLLRKTSEIYPLHVKLLFNICSEWRSTYEVPEEFKACISSKDTIKYLFREIERSHDATVFSRCLFYLNLFDNRGISESELIDILSIDDTVLNIVFKSQHPSVRRFPIGLWLNIKYALGNYITKKETDDGVIVYTWSHQLFINASREYHANMFKEADVSDEMIMNVIDYFNETWNKEKSDGTDGREKEFEYDFKGGKHKFKAKPNGKDNEYLCYRNTKPQMLRYESDDETIIYNRRKLNELVNVIMQLHDRQRKIELLKEHVYFNYEFMLSKAELRDLSFIVHNHAAICELQDEELIAASQIYVNNYTSIEKKPKSLIMNVLSRINSRSEYVMKFSASTNLFLLHKLVDDDYANTVFCPADSKHYILAYYVIQSSPFIFIETQLFEDEDGPVGAVHLVNFKTKEHLGQLDFDFPPMCINIAFFEDHKVTIDRIMDINGLIYFYYDNTVYSSSFTNNEITIVKEFKEKVENLFLLSTKSLLVIFQKKIVNYSSANKTKICQKIHFDENIELIKTTLTENQVYQPSFLNSVDSLSIIIGLSNKHIQIYQFDSKNKLLNLKAKIEDINWNLYGFNQWEKLVDFDLSRVRESIAIDDAYLVDNLKTINDVIIRLAVEQAGVVKVIDVSYDSKYTVVHEIDEMKLNCKKVNNSEHGLELINMFDQKLVLSYPLEDCQKIVYVYDLESKTFIEKQTCGRVDYLHECNLLALSYFTLDLFQVEKSNTSKFLSTNMLLLYPNKTLRVLDNKLLAIETNQYLSYGTSVKEIDILTARNNLPFINSLRIKSILCQLDVRHIIAETDGDEYVIIDVSMGSVLQKIEKHSCIVGVNNVYMISLSNENGKRYLGISKIYKEELCFKFDDVLPRQEFSETLSNSDFEVQFDEDNPLKIIIKILNKEEKSFNVMLIKDEENICRCEIFTIHLNQIESPLLSVLSTVTVLDMYLVVWVDDENTLYYFDPIRDEIFMKNKMDIKVCEIEQLPNSNDILIHDDALTPYVVKIDKNEKKIEVTELKGFTIYIDEAKYFIKNGGDSAPFIINRYSSVIENYGQSMCIAFEKTSVAIISADRELCVLKIIEEGMMVVASIYLEKDVAQLHSSEKYVFGVMEDQRLVVFEIRDENPITKLSNNLLTF